MINCGKCNTEAEHKKFETFEYYYCPKCKTEIKNVTTGAKAKLLIDGQEIGFCDDVTYSVEPSKHSTHKAVDVKVKNGVRVKENWFDQWRDVEYKYSEEQFKKEYECQWDEGKGRTIIHYTTQPITCLALEWKTRYKDSLIETRLGHIHTLKRDYDVAEHMIKEMKSSLPPGNYELRPSRKELVDIEDRQCKCPEGGYCQCYGLDPEFNGYIKKFSVSEPDECNDCGGAGWTMQCYGDKPTEVTCETCDGQGGFEEV